MEQVVCRSPGPEVASSHSSTLGAGARGAGDGDALLLAAGELWTDRHGRGLPADQGQQFADPALDLRLAPARELQGKAMLAGTGAGGQQVEVLEDHADLAAGAWAGSLLAQGDRDPGHRRDDLALGGALQQVDATNEGALAGTRRRRSPRRSCLAAHAGSRHAGVHGITAFTVDFVETDQLNHGFFHANSLKAQGATGGVNWAEGFTG